MNREDLIDRVLREGERQPDEVVIFFVRGLGVSARIK